MKGSEVKLNVRMNMQHMFRESYLVLSRDFSVWEMWKRVKKDVKDRSGIFTIEVDKDDFLDLSYVDGTLGAEANELQHDFAKCYDLQSKSQSIPPKIDIENWRIVGQHHEALVLAIAAIGANGSTDTVVCKFYVPGCEQKPFSDSVIDGANAAAESTFTFFD